MRGLTYLFDSDLQAISVIALFVLYLMSIRKYIHQMDTDMKKTRQLLLLLPPEVLQYVFSYGLCVVDLILIPPLLRSVASLRRFLSQQLKYLGMRK